MTTTILMMRRWHDALQIEVNEKVRSLLFFLIMSQNCSFNAIINSIRSKYVFLLHERQFLLESFIPPYFDRVESPTLPSSFTQKNPLFLTSTRFDCTTHRPDCEKKKTVSRPNGVFFSRQIACNSTEFPGEKNVPDRKIFEGLFLCRGKNLMKAKNSLFFFF